MSAHVHALAKPLTADDRARLGRRAKLLAGTSVAYNVIEAIIAITAGLVAGSVALVGFGLDSIVEVSSGLVILWQFSHRLPETREKQALKLMAVSFFALAGYVTFESVRALLTGHDPDPSTIGIVLAAVSLAVMPFRRGRSATQARRWARTPSWPTPPRRCCAPTCPPSYWLGSS
jgi:divalent metal cation (Fe/Co/Zn/Cd) transporter